MPDHLDALERLVALCVAYCEAGAAEPELYRVMFMDAVLDERDAEVCAGTFETLTAAVAKCVEAGALAEADAASAAAELWVAGHGLVSLGIAGALSPEQVRAALPGLLVHLLVGLGADERHARRAVRS